MKKSVERLVEVLNGGNNHGCNQYGCKAGAGKGKATAGSRQKTKWTPEARASEQSGVAMMASRTAERTGSKKDHAAAAESHLKAAKMFTAVKKMNQAIDHGNTARYHRSKAG